MELKIRIENKIYSLARIKGFIIMITNSRQEHKKII